MSIIEQIELEVEAQANQRSLEVLMLLISKLESLGDSISIDDRLHYYVALKLTRHWFRKKYYNDCLPVQVSDARYATRLSDLNCKIKEARRNYYVAKQRG